MEMEAVNGSIADVHDEYFARQIKLPWLGEEGQKRLICSKVAVIGAGALGCPAATYLAGAGVGEIRIIDGDRVERSNLHRQPAYTLEQASRGVYKAQALAAFLKERAPSLKVTAVPEFIAKGNHRQPLEGADLVLDCCDNFSSRFLIHDACRLMNIDLMQASVQDSAATLQGFRFSRQRSPCLRCLYTQQPSDGCTGSCALNGILGASAGVAASLMAQQALRHISGSRLLEHGRQTLFDLNNLSLMHLEFPGANNAEAGEECACVNILNTSEGDAAVNPEQLIRGGGRIIDLREPEEFRPGDDQLTPGRESISVSRMQDELPRMNPEQQILLICEHGVRSAGMLREMKKQGFTRVEHIPGGYAALRRNSATA